MRPRPANVGLAGSILFALFLIGWGLSFIWGPLADRFRPDQGAGRHDLHVCHLHRPVGDLAQRLGAGAFRLIAGIGIGGEWALAGTYVAEAGRRIAARWARAICRPATTSASFWLPR